MQQEKYRDLDQGKDQSPLITIHMRNTPQQSETRRKRLLKNHSTLGIHSHEKVDRLK